MYQCPRCPLRLGTRNGRQSHVRMHDRTGRLRANAEGCEESTTSPHPSSADASVGRLDVSVDAIGAAHTALWDGDGGVGVAQDNALPAGNLSALVRDFWDRQPLSTMPLYPITETEKREHGIIIESLSVADSLLVDRVRRNCGSKRDAGDDLAFARALRDAYTETTHASQKEDELASCLHGAPALNVSGRGVLQPALSVFDRMSPERFGDFVLLDRKMNATVQCGWMQSRIDLKALKGIVSNIDRGIVHPGAFKSAKEALMEEICANGGFDGIGDYKSAYVSCDSCHCDCRAPQRDELLSPFDTQIMRPDAEHYPKRRLHQTRSGWRDGHAFECITENAPRDESGQLLGKVALFGIYEDGTPMAKSGSISLSILRLWYVNPLRREGRKWVDIGLCPDVEDPTGTISAANLARVRRYVYASFLSLVLRDLSSASSIGMVVESGIVYPRLYAMPCDQPAEMALLHHYKSNCARECGHCDRPTQVEADAKGLKKGSQRLVLAEAKRVEDLEKAIAQKQRELAAFERDTQLLYESCQQAVSGAPSLTTPASGSTCVDIVPQVAVFSLAAATEDAARVQLQELQCEALIRKKAHPEAQNSLEKATDSYIWKGLALLEAEGSDIDYAAVVSEQVALSNAELELAQLADRETSADGVTDAKRQELRHIVSAGRKRLHDLSMHTLPPAIAMIEGVVTGECRMGKIVGLDTLHVSAEGTNRKLADALCDLFLDKGWGKGLVTRSSAVRSLNLRLAQLPGLCSVPAAARVREIQTQTQSGQTAKLRRALTAVLPIALLGLQPGVAPDKDEVLQLALQMAEGERNARSVNVSVAECSRTAWDIQRLQMQHRVIAEGLARIVRVRPDTKMHRVALHTGESFRSFGTIRDMDTDENETMNKKKSISATNDARAEVPENSIPGALTTRARTLRHSCGNAPGRDRTTQEADLAEMRSQLLWALAVTQEPEEGLDLALRPQRPSQAREGIDWCVIERASEHTITATLEWSPGQIFAHRISTRFDSHKRSHRPGVKYFVSEEAEKADNVSTGIVVALARSTRVRKRTGGRCENVAVVLALQETAPSAENMLFVTRFGHTRYVHAMVGEKIRVEVVPCSRLRRAAAIVPDMWQCANIIGKQVEMTQALNTTAKVRTCMAYFELRTVQLSSAPMTYNSEVSAQSGSTSLDTDFDARATDVDENLEMARFGHGTGAVVPATDGDVEHDMMRRGCHDASEDDDISGEEYASGTQPGL